MKRHALLSALLAFVLLSSFKDPNPPAKSTSAAGVYGVSTEKLPFTFELSLNPDHTFHYVNNSVPGKAIDTKGTWEQQGNKITLSHYTSEYRINKVWKLDEHQCLKSRKNLEFTRICLIR